MRPALMINPWSDGEFAATAERLVDGGMHRTEELEAGLRERYPLAVVRGRTISSEQIVTWYVYREGHWIPSGTQ